MAWTRKNAEQMHQAHLDLMAAGDKEVQARMDGKSQAEIRRLEREAVEAARRFNKSASSKKL